MRKSIYISVIILILLLISLIVYNQLPFDITRKSDIRFGEELVSKIESYKTNNFQLPLNGDWKVLEHLGFKLEELGTIPTYQRINENEYEIIYLEGFDPPYLLYNSNDKRWKIDFPKFPKEEKEPNYPWTKEVTQIAVRAILTSIENLNKPELLNNDNFPTDKNNMPFLIKEKTEFIIIGYSYSENIPNIYRIDFHPKNKYKSGPRITVEVDLEKKEAICVYMTPDA